MAQLELPQRRSLAEFPLGLVHGWHIEFSDRIDMNYKHGLDACLQSHIVKEVDRMFGPWLDH